MRESDCRDIIRKAVQMCLEWVGSKQSGRIRRSRAMGLTGYMGGEGKEGSKDGARSRLDL